MNVEIEVNDSESLLNLYKQLIHLRNNSVALSIGEFHSLKTNEQNIVAYVRETGNQTIIVIVNVGQAVENLEMTFPKELLSVGKYELFSMLDSNQFPGFEIISADKDFIYQYDSQIPARKYFLIELKKR
jgi:glycosidase